MSRSVWTVAMSVEWSTTGQEGAASLLSLITTCGGRDRTKKSHSGAFERGLYQKQRNEKTGDHPSRAGLGGVDRSDQICFRTRTGRRWRTRVHQQDLKGELEKPIWNQQRGSLCLLNSAHGFFYWTNSEVSGSNQQEDNQWESILIHFKVSIQFICMLSVLEACLPVQPCPKVSCRCGTIWRPYSVLTPVSALKEQFHGCIRI